MEKALTYLVYLFLVVVWATVGFYIWLPLLFRTSMIFSVALLRHTLVGGDLGPAESALNHAKLFYVTGFSQLGQSLFHPGSVTRSAAVLQGLPGTGIVIREILVAAGFWILVLFLTGVLP